MLRIMIKSSKFDIIPIWILLNQRLYTDSAVSRMVPNNSLIYDKHVKFQIETSELLKSHVYLIPYLLTFFYLYVKKGTLQHQYFNFVFSIKIFYMHDLECKFFFFWLLQHLHAYSKTMQWASMRLLAKERIDDPITHEFNCFKLFTFCLIMIIKVKTVQFVLMKDDD